MKKLQQSDVCILVRLQFFTLPLTALIEKALGKIRLHKTQAHMRLFIVDHLLWYELL